jgi:hypothetical protein
MKRMHLHVSVPNLAQSITFYETLFGSKPAGVRWETFVTFGEATTYGEDEVVSPPASEIACCRPASISAPEKACC